jgi:hypothetical protein
LVIATGATLVVDQRSSMLRLPNGLLHRRLQLFVQEHLKLGIEHDVRSCYNRVDLHNQVGATLPPSFFGGRHGAWVWIGVPAVCFT